METEFFALFVASLNADLAAAGAQLRVSATPPEAGSETMILLDASGKVLGQVPDHADVAILQAIEALLRT